jgi:hypothetical protein
MRKPRAPARRQHQLLKKNRIGRPIGSPINLPQSHPVVSLPNSPISPRLNKIPGAARTQANGKMKPSSPMPSRRRSTTDGVIRTPRTYWSLYPRKCLSDVMVIRKLAPGSALITAAGSTSASEDASGWANRGNQSISTGRNYHWFIFNQNHEVCALEWVHPHIPSPTNHMGMDPL